MKSMRVLLVEDNDDDALLIRESLSETTVEIARAKGLSTALEQLTREAFDAVLLDLSLPDAWGLPTIGRLRQQAASVPIVVLTGLNDEEIAMKAVGRRRPGLPHQGTGGRPLASSRFALRDSKTQSGRGPQRT
jgi:CheY-like chemotaxis protein